MNKDKDSSIQNRQPRTAPGDFGFDDHSRPIPVTWFDHGEIDCKAAPDESGHAGFNLVKFIELLIANGATAQQIGERTLVLAFWAEGVSGRPKNTRELGERMGVSHTTASARLAKINDGPDAVFIECLRNMMTESCQPPYNGN